MASKPYSNEPPQKVVFPPRKGPGTEDDLRPGRPKPTRKPPWGPNSITVGTDS
jgi:hypothetical protein